VGLDIGMGIAPTKQGRSDWHATIEAVRVYILLWHTATSVASSEMGVHTTNHMCQHGCGKSERNAE